MIPALAIGTWLIFFSTKGACWHRALGAIYLALMTMTAVATFLHHVFFGWSGGASASLPRRRIMSQSTARLNLERA
jgi:uncharacterized membrane protein